MDPDDKDKNKDRIYLFQGFVPTKEDLEQAAEAVDMVLFGQWEKS